MFCPDRFRPLTRSAGARQRFFAGGIFRDVYKRQAHEDAGGEILERGTARHPGNDAQSNTEQDQQYAEIPLPAAPELLPYPCDGLLKGTVLFHIDINLSCAYIKSNPITSV